MRNFVSQGTTLEFTASSDVKSGDVVAVGAFIGIAAGDVDNGDKGIVNLTGVYDVPKAGSQAWQIGDRVYWDAALNAGDGAATTDEEGNTLMGVAVAAVGSGAEETIGRVRLQAATNPVASHVANATVGDAAEINALRDALVNAGLMAAQ